MLNVEKLKRLKRERHMTTEVLSALSGVPVGTLNKILSGSTSSPRISTMEALEKTFYDPICVRAEQDRQTMAESGYQRGETLHDQEPAPWYKTGRNTYEDLNALPGNVRAELIGGQIFVMEAPNVVHQFIVDYVGDTVKEYIRSRKGKCVPCTAVGVYSKEDDGNFMIPDLSVVCDPEKITRKGICGAPDFILEVTSPSTEKRDRLEKTTRYQMLGVKEYWILDPERKQLTAYKMFDGVETVLMGLKGKRGLWIFDEKLQIDLSEIRKIIERYG